MTKISPFSPSQATTNLPSSLKKKFLLEYCWFTMLYQFLLYSKVRGIHIFRPPPAFFFLFPSHFSYHRALSRVPCIPLHG